LRKGRFMASTKTLIPQRRKNILGRPRLLEHIHQHLDGAMTLVSAPAGYGKTSLLVDYVHDTDLPVCWYTLDANDANPLMNPTMTSVPLPVISSPP
jgi:LuxR family maltose regulon positive regulatory protein